MKKNQPTPITTNRKARHDYHILQTIETGIVLKGTEVKALRAGKAQLRGAYAHIQNNQAYLHNAHIDHYPQANQHNHNPTTKRKLLLHKREIRQLQQQQTIHHHTLIPLTLYWKNNKIKLQLAIAKNKHHHDKRQHLRTKQTNIETQRHLTHQNKQK